MRVIEIDRDKLLSIIQVELSRLEAQRRFEDTYWKLLNLESILGQLYLKAF